jgi:hypothetical protein
MSDDIVAKLRKRMVRRELGDDPLVKVFGDAADEIERLRVEVKRLRHKVASLKGFLEEEAKDE